MRRASTWVAALALFVALGGTGIAATHYLITSTKQIKPSVLKALRGEAATAEAQPPTEEVKSAVAGTVQLNLANATIFRLGLKETTTVEIELANIPSTATEVTIVTSQSATGKAAIKFKQPILWVGASAPTFSEAGNAVELIVIKIIGGSSPILIGEVVGPLTAGATVPVVKSGEGPTIAVEGGGAVEEGKVLECKPGNWTNSPTGYKYQWFHAGGGEITGATTNKYTLASSDVGYAIYCRVIAENAAGQGSAALTVETEKVKAKLRAPSNTSAPTITGTTTEGGTLEAHTGEWTESPTSYAYQWYHNGGAAISGATSSTYKLVSTDVGKRLYVAVTAHNGAGETTADSAETSTITSSTPGLKALSPGTVALSGTDPEPIAIVASSANVYVALREASAIAQYKRGTEGVLEALGPAMVETGAEPVALAIYASTPGTTYVYVACRGAEKLQVFRVESGGVLALVEEVTIGFEPTGVAVTPNGGYVYVSAAGTKYIYLFEVLHTGKLQALSTAHVLSANPSEEAKAGPTGLAISPDGHLLVSINGRTNTVAYFRVQPTGLLEYVYQETYAQTPQAVAFAGSTQVYALWLGGSDAYITQVNRSGENGWTLREEGMKETAKSAVALVVAADEASGYITGPEVAEDDDAFWELTRNAATGALSSTNFALTVSSIKFPETICVTPDGANVYVAYTGRVGEAAAGIAQYKRIP